MLSPVRRADRLFGIIEVLRSRRVTTAAELAERLEVSVRTIYRDIADLSGSGVPIEGEAGVGYRLGRGFDLPPVMFDAEEVRSLVAGARWVQAWGDASLSAAAERVLAKVEAMLPAPRRSLVRHTPVFAPQFRASPDLLERFERARRAIDAREKVDLDYRDREGRASSRTVRPLGLFFWGSTWALGGWCELRSDYRSFLLDRVERLELLGTVFEDEAAMSLDAFFAAVRGS